MLPQQVLDNKQRLIEYAKNLGIAVEKIQNEHDFLQAFVHKSFAADFKEIGDHNERLEFLGDGILGAVICRLLFQDHPEMEESGMTLYKIALVKEETLAMVARNIKLDEQILISKGEEKMQGRKKDAILSDALESLIGYIFIDLGYQEAENFVKKYVYSMYDIVNKNPVKSYKTMVQEYVQHNTKQTPVYIDFEEVKDSKGNVTKYRSDLTVGGKKVSEGFGTNKKKAQEDAAKNFYESTKN